MIRMIACDIDGTLLQNGQEELPSEMHTLISQLAARGISFCVASGRQFANLYDLFGPSAGRIYYVCENGALVFGKGSQRPIKKLVLPPELIRGLAAAILERPECEILFSGLNTSYLMLKDPASLPKIRPYLGSKIVTVARPEDIEDEIVQISAYCQPDTGSVYEAVSPAWKDQINVVIAGRNWIDFSCAAKGTGLKQLCEELGIAPSEVMAFGDNFNDVSMLDFVGAPVIMENAPEALKDRYPVHCPNVVDMISRQLSGGEFFTSPSC